jgi:hypothetical protein
MTLYRHQPSTQQLRQAVVLCCVVTSVKNAGNIRVFADTWSAEEGTY